MKNKPLIVFVFSFEGTATSTRYGGFVKRLQKAGGLKDCDVLTVALENLLFIVRENGESEVIDSVSGQSLSSASLVYMKSRWDLPAEANALANYLFYKGIPFMDTSALGSVKSKVSTIFRLCGNGIAVPFTLYSYRHDKFYELLSQNQLELGKKFILKDSKGAKGEINYLVSLAEVPGIFAKHPDIQFIAQRFIPNDGDYRIGVYVDRSSFVIKRVGSGDTHLNNISTGGEAIYVKLDDMPDKLLRLAEKAAFAVDLQISGVDIIIDQVTKKPYILEVNQGSQITTGAFTEQNIDALNKALELAVGGRYSRARKQPTRVIGRRVNVKLNEIGIENTIAKVDTGAYSSTLHAENIRVDKDEKGNQNLVFDIIPSDKLMTKDGKVQTIITDKFSDQKVRSSNGQIQHRYSIKTKITIEGRVFPVALTLSDRSEMGYPLLVGRRLLRSRFMVNVELSENNKQEWNY